MQRAAEGILSSESCQNCYMHVFSVKMGPSSVTTAVALPVLQVWIFFIFDVHLSAALPRPLFMKTRLRSHPLTRFLISDWLKMATWRISGAIFIILRVSGLLLVRQI
jgi:hypothetical protein